jgi:protein ImuB
VTVACVDIPALPLQLLWRRQPAWREHPTVVVDEDRPQGEVLWADEKARRLRVLPGQRYAHALSLARGLRAGVVSAGEITTAVDELAAALRSYSPSVEPARERPGTFWLDGDGLNLIFASSEAWARGLERVLAERGLIGAVAVGFTRFGTYAVARAQRRGTVIFACDADERATARTVTLDRLDVEPALRDALARLGVTTLGQMVRLPGGGILERFGRDAHRFYQLAARERWDPLVPEPPPEAPDERVLLDDPETDVERLLFSIKTAVDRLLARLAARRRAVTALWLELNMRVYGGPPSDKHQKRVDCIRAAEPTLDLRTLLRLCHLRLEGQPPAHGVVEVRVWADDLGATREQLALFAARPRRDLRAASEAVARLRAELGDDAVVRPVLREGHLPEARFGWEPAHAVSAPQPRPTQVRALVRRLLTRPRILTAQATSVRDDGWLIGGLEQGSVIRIDGPFILSGGWWMSAEPADETCRDYHFAETRRGDCLWLYFDRRRRRWFQHGAVE